MKIINLSIAALLVLLITALLSATWALAAEHLIPEPYPGALGGHALEPASPGPAGTPRLLPQPAPQAYGPHAAATPRSGQYRNPYPWTSWCNGASSCSTLR
ncbi:MAG TPA: hypothetical protein VKV77_06725 [Methylovirgula sp.]|nr:hypothetical protein [Methylovirgula sp.]